MLSVAPKDRDYLRFFYPIKEGELVYRHCRIVFGLNSSPFLLNASLKHLLDNAPSEYCDVVEKLKCSFYVDNCLSGVHNVTEEEYFIDAAKKVLSKGCFDLRGWQKDSNDLIPLTPSLFLNGQSSYQTIDLDLSEFSKFQKRIRYRRKLIEDFRSRFRKEYLGQLRQKLPYSENK
ncbi:integrase_H2C2 domain-containing protein, partial [Trichonephila inaurata madagascariensis]